MTKRPKLDQIDRLVDEIVANRDDLMSTTTTGKKLDFLGEMEGCAVALLDAINNLSETLEEQQ